jgi:hypothetical protein
MVILNWSYEMEDEKPLKPTLHFKFTDNYENFPLSCGCGWRGKLDDDGVEVYEEVMDFTCPDCDKILAIISSCGGEGIGGVISPFESKQNPVQMDEQEDSGDSFINIRKNFLKNFDEESLKSFDQLPDLEGNCFAFVWDDNFMEGKTVILLGDKVIWSEPKVWEGARRFVEVVDLLKAKYGKNFIDLIPTEQSYLYLLGDRYSLLAEIEEARHKISKEPPLTKIEAEKLVRKYCDVIGKIRLMPCNENRLPASKEIVKEAIKICFRLTDDSKVYTSLRNGYLELAGFQPNVSPEVEELLEKSSDIVESNPDSLETENFALKIEKYLEVEKIVSEEKSQLHEEIVAWEKQYWDELLFNKKK